MAMPSPDVCTTLSGSIEEFAKTGRYGKHPAPTVAPSVPTNPRRLTLIPMGSNIISTLMKKLILAIVLMTSATLGLLAPFDSANSGFGLVFAQGGQGQGAQNQDPWAPANFNNFRLRAVGPAIMSGRINVVAVHPE